MSFKEYLHGFKGITINLMNSIEDALTSCKIKYDRVSDGEIIIKKTKKINMNTILKKVKDYDLNTINEIVYIGDMDDNVVLRLKFVGNEGSD